MSLLKMVPTFKVYEWSQIDTMGDQNGKKPWLPIGTGQIHHGRVLIVNNSVNIVPGY